MEQLRLRAVMGLRQRREAMELHPQQVVTGIHQQQEAMEHQRREGMELRLRQAAMGHLLLVGMVNERGMRTENNG
jgi:hypothetical protein